MTNPKIFLINGKYRMLYLNNKYLAYKGDEAPALPRTFYPTGAIQSFIVPQGVTKLHVVCVASKGKDSLMTPSVLGGNGGRVECDLTVTSGQTLYFVVGDIPYENNTLYNASDIRTNNAGITNTTSLNSRLVVAGGGGNAGHWGRNGYTYAGGVGGGLEGGAGNSRSGQGGNGGTQTAGGAGGGGSSGSGGSAGGLGLGGKGGDNNGGGGAGGAGYYGGGGGGRLGHDGHSYSGGGGGGSSYTDSSKCTNVVHTQGFNDGTGYITISQA